MTSKSAQIRELAHAGISVSDIAKRLGIAYQHAYKVCRDAGLIVPGAPVSAQAAPALSKPKLTKSILLDRGFKSAGEWQVKDVRLSGSEVVPRAAGVYAFCIGDDVVYVGLASRSLAQRLYFYGRPGASQRTNIRLNGIIRETIGLGSSVEIYYACPPAFSWNGFTISGPEGLEAGLIQDYHLPWNVKGA